MELLVLTPSQSKDEALPLDAPPAPSPTGAGGEEEDAGMQLLSTVLTRSSSSSSHHAGAAEEEAADAAVEKGGVALSKGMAYVLLNLVTVLWGTQHAVIKAGLLAAPDHPGTLNALRFALAALLFLPWTPSPLAAEQRQGIWRAGGELGLWMFAGAWRAFV